MIERIYRAAGSPSVPGLMSYEDWQSAPAKKKPTAPPVGKCYLSGIDLHRAGVPVDVAIKSTFTAHSRAAVRDSEWVSPEAAFSISEKVFIPGLSKLSAMRQFTHVVIGDKWRTLGLRDKKEISSILSNPPKEEWGMVICTKPMSAQHVLFRAGMNLGGEAWEVYLNDLSARSNSAQFRALFADVEEQYKFHYKEMIAWGRYLPKNIALQGEGRWRAIEERIGAARFTPLFDLVLFLAQKDEKEKEDEDGEEG